MDNWDKLALMTKQAPHARAVIELLGWNTATWNAIEDKWYLLFTSVAHELPRDKLDIVYRQHNTGHAKRTLVNAVGKLAFAPYPAYVEELQALYKETNEAGEFRNQMTHGRYVPDISEGKLGLRIAPLAGSKEKTSKFPGANADLVTDFEELNHRLEVLQKRLENFLVMISQEIYKQPLLSKAMLDSMPEDVRNDVPRRDRERFASERFRIGDGPFTAKKD